jgi:diguanylate cyclase (GGDEF)-like protein/PAS domain S-box-containing protein
VIWEGLPAVQITARDITEHKHLQDKLRITGERLKLAVEGTGEGIWDWDLISDTYSVSGSLKRIFGWEENDDADKKINWRTLIHPDDFSRVNAAIRSCIKGDNPIYECEFRLKTTDGQWKWVAGRGVVVEWDHRGNPTAMTGTISDITARKDSEDQIWRHANLDALTGLPNRRMFRDQLDAEIRKAHRTGNELALLFLDMDGFKQVNDLFGHESGDRLLTEAAFRLKSCVRETDVVARLGGDEFTVVLGGLDCEGHVEFVCQKILCSLAQPFRIGSDFAYVTASIGVALYPVDGTSVDELSRKADHAMYAAKAAGKNQFCYFTRAMDEKAHMRLRMSNELHHALTLDQFSVHYQPIVNLSNGHVVKAEALLRWKHPILGNVMPSMFVPLAEENGLMSQIGTWIFQEAAAKSKRWSEMTGRQFQVSINKSPVQFMARDIETDWLEYLSSSGIPCTNIVIEITEGILLHASSNVMSKLLEYRDAGVQVAIDDFGTGYSSMAYLKKFHIDYLKIDRSFVQDIEKDQGSRTIVETMVVMAHKLGIAVIAEGIETVAQAKMLASAGCDYGQGFFFSAPVLSDVIEQMLSRKFLS